MLRKGFRVYENVSGSDSSRSWDVLRKNRESSDLDSIMFHEKEFMFLKRYQDPILTGVGMYRKKTEDVTI